MVCGCWLVRFFVSRRFLSPAHTRLTRRKCPCPHPYGSFRQRAAERKRQGAARTLDPRHQQNRMCLRCKTERHIARRFYKNHCKSCMPRVGILMAPAFPTSRVQLSPNIFLFTIGCILLHHRARNFFQTIGEHGTPDVVFVTRMYQRSRTRR